MKPSGAPTISGARQSEPASHRLFYWVFLPLGSLSNLGLGLVVLTRLGRATELSTLQLGAGAFCCVIAGWLASVAWSRLYWNRSMARQVAVWHRIADIFFAWLEEAPVPADALRTLKSSLEEAVPSPQRD